MTYDILTAGEEILDAPVFDWDSIFAGSKNNKVITALGVQKITLTTSATFASLIAKLLPLTSIMSSGANVDATAFTLENGKVICNLDGVVKFETQANVASSAYDWLQTYLLLEFPNGTNSMLHIGNDRAQPSTSYGKTVYGSQCFGVQAGTKACFTVKGTNAAVKTLGNNYWFQATYLWSK